MENILEVLEDKRADANILDKERMQKDKGSEEVSGSESHPTTQQTSPVHTVQGSPQPGRPLIHKPDCRICKQLEKKGIGDDLFQGHLGRFFNECPKFVAMTRRTGC